MALLASFPNVSLRPTCPSTDDETGARLAGDDFLDNHERADNERPKSHALREKEPAFRAWGDAVLLPFAHKNATEPARQAEHDHNQRKIVGDYVQHRGPRLSTTRKIAKHPVPAHIFAGETMSQTPILPFPTPLRRGTFIRRYKRFFVDVQLDGPEGEVTAHTPNTGSMSGLLNPGAPVLLSHDPSPKRKLSWTLQAIAAPESVPAELEARFGNRAANWVGCNTMLPNRYVESLVMAKRVPALQGYETCRREVPYGENKRSRIDLLLQDHEQGMPDCLVEVKNVTLRQGDFALFPDAVSARGRKHLEDLQAEVQAGRRAAMLYLVQRTDCRAFLPADAIDSAYGQELRRAMNAGVEVYVCCAQVEADGLYDAGALPLGDFLQSATVSADAS